MRKRTHVSHMDGGSAAGHARAKEELRKSEASYRRLFENHPHPMWVYDLDTRAFLAVNDAAIAEYGYTRDEFLGMTITDIRPQEELPRLMQDLAEPRLTFEHSEGWKHRLKDGTVIDVNISSHVIDWGGRRCALVMAQNVTETRRAQARTRYLTRLYATISQVNQAIVRVKDRGKLLQRICDVAMQFGEFRMAWIGWLDPQTGAIQPLVHAGHEDGYLQLLHLNIRDEAHGTGPSVQAIHTAKAVFIDDIQTDPGFRPWRQDALARGYRSCAVIPIRGDHRVTATFTLYASEPGFFNQEEMQLLEEIGQDISFALDAMALEAERSHLFNAIERSLNEIYIFDPETLQFEYVNRGALQNLGYTPEQIHMLTPVDLKPEFTEETFRQLVAPLLRDEEQEIVTETVHRRADGSLYPVEVHLQLIRERDRSFFLAVVLDISERRRTAAELRESEQRYRGVLSSMMEGCQIVDYDWRYIYVNETAALQGRRRADELLMHTMMEIYPGIEETDLFRTLQICMSERVHRRMQNEFQFPDGSRGWFELSIQPVPEGLFILSVDITERKQTEEALRSSEEKYRSLVNNVPDGVYRTSPEGRMLAANPALVKMLGFASMEELQSINARDLYYDAQDRSRALERMQDPHKAHNIEAKLKRKDGQPIIVLDNGRPIYDENGNVLYFEGTLTDITDRKRAEEALRLEGERFQRFVESNIVGIVIAELDGKVVLANDYFLRLLGASRLDLEQGRVDWRRATPPEWLAADERAMQKLQERGVCDPYEKEYQRADGTRIPVYLARTMLPGPDLQMAFFVLDITERKRAEERIKQQLGRIAGLREVDRAITSSFDLRVSMNSVLDQVARQLGAEASAISTLDMVSSSLTCVAARGLRRTVLERSIFRLGKGLAGAAIMEHRTVHHPDIRSITSEDPQMLSLLEQGLIDYYGVPLVSKGQVKGILEVFQRAAHEPNPEWLEYLETLAGQAAIAIDNIQMLDGLNRSNLELAQAYDATIEGWSHALDLRDKETEGHTKRVTELTLALARRLGIDEKDLTKVRWGALLHDIGKMGIPDSILLKPGPLTADEWTQMKKHPQFAYEMLAPIQYLRGALDIPLSHHEKWDGTGYPRGLKGEQIPLAARIFAIVDIWDALRSDRPYRPAWPEDKTLEHIRSLAGTHLDPRVVDTFFSARLYETGAIDSINRQAKGKWL